MGGSTEPGLLGGFFLLKRDFSPLHCPYIHAQYEGLLQSQPVTVHFPYMLIREEWTANKSLTRYNLLAKCYVERRRLGAFRFHLVGWGKGWHTAAAIPTQAEMEAFQRISHTIATGACLHEVCSESAMGHRCCLYSHGFATIQLVSEHGRRVLAIIPGE
ncbi:hypothetical protein CRENBAI_000470 [Crenichthys baileyi]|uniref:Uncharacterized protein n=1 Tax=Crenichthys baileyi TaxID=28760 RepID=A0AAV9SNF5_9TELE